MGTLISFVFLNISFSSVFSKIWAIPEPAEQTKPKFEQDKAENQRNYPDSIEKYKICDL